MTLWAPEVVNEEDEIEDRRVAAETVTLLPSAYYVTHRGFVSSRKRRKNVAFFALEQEVCERYVVTLEYAPVVVEDRERVTS